MFARRGFSMIAKLGKVSINGAPRVLPQARFVSQAIPRQPGGAMTGVTQELLDSLKEEIDLEKQNQQEAKTVRPTIPGFEIKTRGAEVTLTKKQGNETVKIIFDVSHSVDLEHEEELDGESPDPTARPPFEFQVIKGDKKLVFDADIVQGEEGGYDFFVNEFYLADAKDEKVPDHVYRSSGGYIDPALGDLLFKRYLEEHGLNDELLEKIVQLATCHEHSEYVTLLEGLKNFLEK